MKRRVRVLMIADISGEGPGYHVGDEAMAEVAIERLKAIFGPQNLVMACSSASAVPTTYSIASFAWYSMSDEARRKLLLRPHSFVKSLAVMFFYLLRCRVVFVCGGGNLTSVWPEVLESRLYLLRWARRLGKKMFLVSQTLGPFVPHHRIACYAVLEKAEWIGVRDKQFSQKQIGLPVHFAVDDAVFLSPLHSTTTDALVKNNRPLLSVSMRKFAGSTDEQLAALGGVIRSFAAKNNFSTVFIPHHAPGGQGDIRLAKNIQHLWSEDDPLVILDPIPRAAALKALTGDSVIVLTMRYHQLIFALSMGVPAVGIYVDEYTCAKLSGAFEHFEMEPRVLHITEAITGIELLAQTVLNERDLYLTAAKKTHANALADNMLPYKKLDELYPHFVA